MLPITQHQDGFLKVALPSGSRLHVWAPWNPPTMPAAPHDHPFGFVSVVIAGEMQNVILRPEQDLHGTYQECLSSCVSSFELQPIPEATSRRVRFVEEQIQTVRRGEFYRMVPWTIHRADAVFAMTIFRKTHQVPGHARVYVREAPSTWTPPDESLLQGCLERALTAARLSTDDILAMDQEFVGTGEAAFEALSLADNPGYHLRTVPKAPFGTADKVLEEALELVDAYRQGAKVMALCECADIVGAVQAYLDHEGGNFDDIRRMAAITSRAFASGRRR